MEKRDIIYVAIIVLLLAIVGYFLFQSNDTTVIVAPEDETIPVEPDGGIGDGAEPLDEILLDAPTETVGTSVTGTDIVAYRFGTGENDILLAAGIHGGYSWNTSQLAYELINYYEANPDEVPASVRLHIIPALNPDGLVTTLGTVDDIDTSEAATVSDAERVAGRFNANDVDLNRNFGCNWEAEGVWRNQNVSGGDAPFSEPEAAALRDYVNRIDPNQAIVWFSAEGKVYPSACDGAPSSASITLANTFGSAAVYETERSFDSYALTGDMVNWLASESIPAISVLLTDYQNTEFEKNLAGIEAVLENYE